MPTSNQVELNILSFELFHTLYGLQPDSAVITLSTFADHVGWPLLKCIPLREECPYVQMSSAYSRAYYGAGAQWMTDECGLLNESLDKHFSMAALWTRERTGSPGSQPSCGCSAAPGSTARLWPGEATEGLWRKYLKFCYSAFLKKALLNLLQYCFFFFFLLWGIWGLSTPIRDGTWTPCIERYSPNHWPAREVPASQCLFALKPVTMYAHHLFKLPWQRILQVVECKKEKKKMKFW